ncbi:hypothetical protein Sango_1587800 [Sesamum angolense]|uniref:Uncharacterized protein n=1 Tax=Sesamum angolense TaxID=2727404 RepID=A0AAE1WQN8_9LAMI|nr:hypothetical protein Sango_1587800 [Sesamum angolense]
MVDAKPISTPFPPGITVDTGSLLPALDKFCRLVGRLLYLVFTRPYISFSIQQLSQFLKHLRTSHWDTTLHVFRYLKGISSLGLFFAFNSPMHLSAYSDAAGPPAWTQDDRLLGSAFSLGLLSSIGRLRSRLRSPYHLLKRSIVQHIQFWCENKTTLHITVNPIFHERTKHLDIDCHLVRDQFKLGFISPSHISGSDQPADLFTLLAPVFSRLLSKLVLGSQAPS